MRSLTNRNILIELEKDIYARRYFVGVFPRDKLPSKVPYPSALIVNTHPMGSPGEHWLAMFFNKAKNCEFFDSFGFTAKDYGFEKYIESLSREYKNNVFQMQDIDSNACGYYSIYFILLKSRGFSLEDINNLFSKTNFKINDYLISHIVN